jgi:cell division topological specificity factor
MKFLDYFRSNTSNSASVAKERLQIIVAHERGRANAPHYLPLLQKDLLEVVRKYVPVNEDQVTLTVDRNDGCEVLELNISLPDAADSAASGAAPAQAAPAPQPRPDKGNSKGSKRRKSKRR